MGQTFYQTVAARLRTGGRVLLLTRLPGADGHSGHADKALLAGGELTVEHEARRAFWQTVMAERPASLPCIFPTQGERVLVEELVRSPRLVICGGGHISAPLAALGAMLDFDVTVIDDREEFANRRRFPTAGQILCQPFTSALSSLQAGPNTYYVIVTRGHSADRECLELILKRPAAYVGMIGSRQKVAVVMEQMCADGYSREALAGVYAPIGLKIGAQTPAEIAICIAAQIIEVLRHGAAEGRIEEDMLALLERGESPMVLATILEKSGSAPRSMGARMLILADGSLCGSIGGGAGEAQACAAARQVLQSGVPCLVECDMTNEDAKREGMVCGGKITVLLERL